MSGKQMVNSWSWRTVTQSNGKIVVHQWQESGKLVI